MTSNSNTDGFVRPPDSAGPHPSVEAWIDYYEKKAPDGEREGLKQHLVDCRQCLDLVLDLDAFAEPSPPRADAAADFEKAAVWRTVKSVIESQPVVRTRRWPAIVGVAASLVLATLGLSALTEQRSTLNELRNQVASLSQLQANVPIVDLRPGARERSSGGVDATVELPAAVGFALVLNLEDEVDFPAYELRVVDAAAVEVRRISGLLISDAGNFRLAVPPGSFAAGNYELQLVGLGGGAEEPIETYPIRLR